MDIAQDALSDILRLIRLKGCVYFQSDFSSPWGMEMGTTPFAQFHVVVRGQCWLSLGETQHFLTTGDIIIIPHGNAHDLRDEPQSTCVPGLEVLGAIQSGETPFADGEFTTRLLCGHFEFDRDLNHPFVTDLPELICVKGMGRKHEGWLEAITPILVGETGAGEPGADSIAERLAEVLLIQVLRIHAQDQTTGQGFLTALGDRRINAALKYIHSATEQDVTLDDIARAVGMSRSNLAARFKDLVGDTPMNYLTTWRMLRAKDILRSGTLPIVDVAEQVGYTSEAAFSRAFKRAYNQNPSHYRRDTLV